MVKTRKTPVPYDEMLKLIAIATAARKAQKERRKVMLREIWKQKVS